MKQTTKLVIICFLFLVTFIIVNTLLDSCIKYFYNKGKESARKEYKIEKEKQQEKVLGGMNYNNSEGWYKNCKVKVIYYDNFKHGWENYINEFISGKDVVDIKTCKDRILIVYIEPSFSENIIIEEK